MVHAITVHRPILMFMPYSHIYYSSIMHLPQGYHAMSMCPDIILFNLHYTYVHYEKLMSLNIILTLNSS